jgi:hypothetical protein
MEIFIEKQVCFVMQEHNPPWMRKSAEINNTGIVALLVDINAIVTDADLVPPAPCRRK